MSDGHIYRVGMGSPEQKRAAFAKDVAHFQSTHDGRKPTHAVIHPHDADALLDADPDIEFVVGLTVVAAHVHLSEQEAT